MRWTEEQLEQFKARQLQQVAKSLEHEANSVISCDDQPERVLQDRIESWCRENGFYAFHDRSRKCNAPGHPDLVIALKGGRVLWLELKSRGGRLRPEQEMVGKLLTYCGHEWHCVRSWKRFMEIVESSETET